MTEERLKELLGELTNATTEPVRQGLGEDIKHRIPQTLMPHRGGWDTINIIIDLRVSKLTAAAVIILTLLLLANLFGGRDATGADIFQDSKLLIGYWLSGENAHKSDVLAGMSGLYEYLAQQGKEVTYYGDCIEPEDGSAVLMHWKLSDDNYRVIFSDLRIRTVGAEDLIRLQARMLQNITQR